MKKIAYQKDKATKKDFENIAKNIAKEIKKGDTILLIGELGTGKTFFTNKLCKHLNAKNIVNSPSYVLLNEYTTETTKIYHYDLYRLANAEEAMELGIFDRIKEGITIIEWPEKIKEYLPKNTIEIHIEHADDSRNIKIKKIGGIK